MHCHHHYGTDFNLWLPSVGRWLYSFLEVDRAVTHPPKPSPTILPSHWLIYDACWLSTPGVTRQGAKLRTINSIFWIVRCVLTCRLRTYCHRRPRRATWLRTTFRHRRCHHLGNNHFSTDIFAKKKRCAFVYLAHFLTDDIVIFWLLFAFLPLVVVSFWAVNFAVVLIAQVLDACLHWNFWFMDRN